MTLQAILGLNKVTRCWQSIAKLRAMAKVKVCCIPLNSTILLILCKLYAISFVFKFCITYVFIRWFDLHDKYYLDMCEKYAVWFTEYLGAETRLGFSHPEIDGQIVNPKYIYNKVNYHPKTK